MKVRLKREIVTPRVPGLDPTKTVGTYVKPADWNRLIQDPDVVVLALDQLRRKPAIGFSDCLIVEIARKAGHLPLGSFDRTLGRVDGAQQLKS